MGAKYTLRRGVGDMADLAIQSAPASRSWSIEVHKPRLPANMTGERSATTNGNDMPRRRRVLNTARAAKEIVRESRRPGESERLDVEYADVLTEFDRSIVGGHESVRINFPLRDPAECYQHAERLEEVARQIRQKLKLASKKDRSQLFMVRGMLRALHKEINAYRSRSTRDD